MRHVLVPGLLTCAISLTLLPAAFAEVAKPGPYYVIVDNTQVLLAPDPKGKSTNVIYKRQKVDVLEVKGEWARVSRYYDGEPEGVSGQVARWVRTKDLATTAPVSEKVSAGDPPVATLLIDSDDFARHRAAFIKASQTLLENKTCTLQDFKEGGGWSKSTNHGRGVYFAYCGGSTKANRLYLNVNSGEVFR